MQDNGTFCFVTIENWNLKWGGGGYKYWTSLIRVHSVMKNEPFDGRTSFVKKLKASQRATSTLCFNISSAHHIKKKNYINNNSNNNNSNNNSTNDNNNDSNNNNYYYDNKISK